jgi:hypothetical protein
VAVGSLGRGGSDIQKQRRGEREEREGRRKDRREEKERERAIGKMRVVIEKHQTGEKRTGEEGRRTGKRSADDARIEGERGGLMRR